MKKLGRFSSFLRNLFIVVATILIAVTVVYASTTIGSNVNTGGTLTASGDTSLASATTTGTLYVTSYASSTGGLFTQGDLHAGGTASFDGSVTLGDAVADVILSKGTFQATTTALFTGAATFYSTVNVSGLTTLATATSTSATTSDYLMVGRGTPTSGNFNYKGDLWVKDTVEIGGYATSTSGLFTKGDGHIGGWFTVDGNATSSGNFSIGKNTNAATTTLSIKAIGASGQASCIEMIDSAGAIKQIYVNGNAIVVQAGACK